VARPGKHWPMVEASRDEASLAVRLYNDPAEVRAFEGFVVHMHLAWLYLLHAEFTRDKVDYRYWRRDNPRLLEKVDGEPKRYELASASASGGPTTRTRSGRTSSSSSGSATRSSTATPSNSKPSPPSSVGKHNRCS